MDREFGPPSILQLHHFYLLASSILESHSEMVVYYCLDNAYRFTTAACYIGTFRMLYAHVTADEAFAPFARLSACFMLFNDSSLLPPTHLLTVQWYLRGFQKGVSNGWYSPQSFDPSDYEYYSRSSNGDMNWIVPGKLLALATPYMKRRLPDGHEVALPGDLVKVFKTKGITHIVRLNEKLYDERIFTKAGFRHTELFFEDGGCPPVHIREAFLRIINGKDVVALHCRAGIGRTFV
jgi:cell division cycle 14